MSILSQLNFVYIPTHDIDIEIDRTISVCGETASVTKIFNHLWSQHLHYAQYGYNIWGLQTDENIRKVQSRMRVAIRKRMSIFYGKKSHLPSNIKNAVLADYRRQKIKNYQILADRYNINRSTVKRWVDKYKKSCNC